MDLLFVACGVRACEWVAVVAGKNQTLGQTDHPVVGQQGLDFPGRVSCGVEIFLRLGDRSRDLICLGAISAALLLVAGIRRLRY